MVEIELDKKQARTIAHLIILDVEKYIEEHYEDYQKFLELESEGKSYDEL